MAVRTAPSAKQCASTVILTVTVTFSLEGTPPTPQLPPAPVNPRAAVNGATVTLSWELSGNTAGIVSILEVWALPSMVRLFAGSVGPLTQVSGPVPPGTYAFRVFAANSQGQGPPSSDVSFTVGSTSPTLPGPPGTLTSSRSGTFVTLNWSPPTTGGPVSDYLVGVGSGTMLSNLLVIPTGAVTLSGTAGPGTYFVRVRARNAAGTGPASNEVVVTIAATEGGLKLTFFPR